MIGEICAYIKNHFAYASDRHIGDWTISSGTISPTLELPTDYIRIIGSRKNDGVWKVSELATKLKDEEFHGAIWIMSPPQEFLDLVTEIGKWLTDNAGAVNSPYNSESFGGYSYTKVSASNNDQNAASWQGHFAKRLNQWRKL